MKSLIQTKLCRLQRRRQRAPWRIASASWWCEISRSLKVWRVTSHSAQNSILLNIGLHSLTWPIPYRSEGACSFSLVKLISQTLPPSDIFIVPKLELLTKLHCRESAGFLLSAATASCRSDPSNPWNLSQAEDTTLLQLQKDTILGAVVVVKKTKHAGSDPALRSTCITTIWSDLFHGSNHCQTPSNIFCLKQENNNSWKNMFTITPTQTCISWSWLEPHRIGRTNERSQVLKSQWLRKKVKTLPNHT